jgi:hypothetical protein
MALLLKTNARTTEAPTCENCFSHIVGRSNVHDDGRIWRAQACRTTVRVHRRVRIRGPASFTFVPWWKTICHLSPVCRHIELLSEKGEACLSCVTPITLYVTRQIEALSSRTLKSSTIRSIGAHSDIAAMISPLDQTFPEAPNSTKSAAISKDASSAGNFLPT